MRAPVEVADGVHQLRLFGARVTVISTGDETVLADAGPRGSAGAIMDGLSALDIAADQLRLVALTHHHPDHSGGLAGVVEATGARVAVHQLDAGIINGKEELPSPWPNPLLAAVTRPFLSPVYGIRVDVDHELQDGDLLPGQPDVTVIHVPGHTPGSICLLVASKRVLIVGDSLQYRFGKLQPPAPAVTVDYDQAVESLHKLLPLDFDTIAFSHFPPLKTQAKEKLRAMLETAPASAT